MLSPLLCELSVDACSGTGVKMPLQTVARACPRPPELLWSHLWRLLWNIVTLEAPLQHAWPHPHHAWHNHNYNRSERLPPALEGEARKLCHNCRSLRWECH